MGREEVEPVGQRRDGPGRGRVNREHRKTFEGFQPESQGQTKGPFDCIICAISARQRYCKVKLTLLSDTNLGSQGSFRANMLSGLEAPSGKPSGVWREEQRWEAGHAADWGC